MLRLAVRIIAGEFRRRRLLAPDGLVTRPIPDRVKESLFSMLGARVQGAAVVDLFAGTGSIGLEAVSRGAASCLLVERDKDVARVLQANIDALGESAQRRCKVVLGDALGQSLVARVPRPLDLLFLDPPYPIVRVQSGWDRVRHQAGALAAHLAADGFLVLRTPWPFLLDPEPAPGEALPAQAASQRARRDGRARPRDDGGRGHWRDASDFAHEQARARREARRTARVDGLPDGPDAMLRLGDIDADDGALDTDEAIAAAGQAGGVGARGTPADLHIPGCKGPETHAYGSTAVHWYMRG